MRRLLPRQFVLLFLLTAPWLPPAAVRAEVLAWYELVGSASPGPNDLVVQQGGPGRPLRITTDSYAGLYQLRIRLVIDCPEEEDLLAYAVDLAAPYVAHVQAHSFRYIASFDYVLPPTVAAGPGVLISGASQFNVVDPVPGGELELFEFVLTITRPPPDRIEIYSAIGLAAWTRLDGSVVMVAFADSPALPGWETGLLSATPSIIIDQAPPAAPPPPPGGTQGQGTGGGNPNPPNGSSGTDPAPTPSANAPPSADASGELPSDENAPPRSGRMFDRRGLRSFLGAVFAMPVDDMPPSAIVPAGLSWVLGFNIHGLLSVFDALGIPLRSMLFEMAYAGLDAALP